MPTQRPQVAGYVDVAVKRRMTRLRETTGQTESKIVEYLVNDGLPKLEQAVKGAPSQPLLLVIGGSPTKPQSR